jgi:hypothetical protein
MSKYPESFTVMKEVAPGAFLMDGKQTTQLLLTGSEPGNALEKKDGNPSKRKAGLLRPFSFVRR